MAERSGSKVPIVPGLGAGCRWLVAGNWLLVAEPRPLGSATTKAETSGAGGSAPLKTYVQIIDSTRPGVPRSPLADARGYGSASSSPLVGQQAHGHSVEDASSDYWFHATGRSSQSPR